MTIPLTATREPVSISLACATVDVAESGSEGSTPSPLLPVAFVTGIIPNVMHNTRIKLITFFIKIPPTLFCNLYKNANLRYLPLSIYEPKNATSGTVKTIPIEPQSP